MITQKSAHKYLIHSKIRSRMWRAPSLSVNKLNVITDEAAYLQVCYSPMTPSRGKAAEQWRQAPKSACYCGRTGLSAKDRRYFHVSVWKKKQKKLQQQSECYNPKCNTSDTSLVEKLSMIGFRPVGLYWICYLFLSRSASWLRSSGRCCYSVVWCGCERLIRCTSNMNVRRTRLQQPVSVISLT